MDWLENEGVEGDSDGSQQKTAFFRNIKGLRFNNRLFLYRLKAEPLMHHCYDEVSASKAREDERKEKKKWEKRGTRERGGYITIIARQRTSILR